MSVRDLPAEYEARWIADYLGDCGKSWVQKVLLPRFLEAFSERLAIVRRIRGKVF